MPYSDNLYSADAGADTDQHVLSPSDGYFSSSATGSAPSHATPHVPNVMVADPSLEQRTADEADSKARESYTPHPARASSPSAPTTTSSVPRSTLIHARPPSVYSEAPPAYSPSASSPASPTSPLNDTTSNNRSYNTFSATMGSSQEAEYDPLLGRRTPQSMTGRPADVEAGMPRRWGNNDNSGNNNNSIRSRLPSWARNWKAIVGGIILLAIVLGLIAGPAHNSGNDSTIVPSHPIETRPGEPEYHSPSDGNGPLFTPKHCKDAKFRFDDLLLPLDATHGKDLSLVQNLYDGEGRSYLSVSGAVTIRQAKDGQSPEIRLQMVTDYEDLHLKVTLDNPAQQMTVGVPNRVQGDYWDKPPCLEIQATVWLPADAKLGQLNVDVISLGIFTLDDLSLHLAKLLKLTSVSGNIGSGLQSADQVLRLPASQYAAPPGSYVLDSRVVKVHTTSGRIDGHYPLYDVLDLHTTSGNIGVSITPHDELSSAPRSAELTVGTTSGTVHANMPIEEGGGAGASSKIPRRNYAVTIKGTSGTIGARLVQGSNTYIRTTSGTLDLTFLPVIDVGKYSPKIPVSLEASTTSSHIDLKILDPVWFGTGSSSTADVPVASGGGQVLDMLKASYKTTSGSVSLRYPQSWEGELHAATTSGSIEVRGRDVQKISYDKGWVGQEILVRKGAAGSGTRTEVRTMSGSVKAVLGLER
ncbi:hypothetical protein Micbo1qcDRAFT_236770 [Microdochium bolleyi]|uniref:Adhesin domain-containing protein n=1 Tax=Microdochium bolleyi TaxID=196109 RepID=A0A136IP70_9PEZI|nr:hypothetical protein Micbo1qcDRAFT_236770 [Microdochium bolleyi]